MASHQTEVLIDCIIRFTALADLYGLEHLRAALQQLREFYRVDDPSETTVALSDFHDAVIRYLVAQIERKEARQPH